MGTRQSEELAAETSAMRAFDRALQAVEELPGRARLRVLTYVHDCTSDLLGVVLPAATSFVTAHGGGSLGGNGSNWAVDTATGTVVGGGGAGSNSGSSPGGPGGGGGHL